MKNRSNSVTFPLVTSNVVFVPAVFTLLESQEGDTINSSRGETQSDPHQSKAAPLSEDTAGFVTWPAWGSQWREMFSNTKVVKYFIRRKLMKKIVSFMITYFKYWVIDFQDWHPILVKTIFPCLVKSNFLQYAGGKIPPQPLDDLGHLQQQKMTFLCYWDTFLLISLSKVHFWGKLKHWHHKKSLYNTHYVLSSLVWNIKLGWREGDVDI